MIEGQRDLNRRPRVAIGRPAKWRSISKWRELLRLGPVWPGQQRQSEPPTSPFDETSPPVGAAKINRPARAADGERIAGALLASGLGIWLLRPVSSLVAATAQSERKNWPPGLAAARFVAFARENVTREAKLLTFSSRSS